MGLGSVSHLKEQ